MSRSPKIGYPDDLLPADVNGATTIPKEIIAEAAGVEDAFMAAA